MDGANFLAGVSNYGVISTLVISVYVKMMSIIEVIIKVQLGNG